jgi:hypothetical protein
LAAGQFVNTSTRLFLIEQILAENPARTRQIIKLLLDRSREDETEVFALLLTRLLDQSIRPDDRLLPALQAIAEKDRNLKKMLKRLTK